MVYTRKTRKTGPVKKFSRSRVCKKYKCKQRLSVYNSENYCYAHKREFLE